MTSSEPSPPAELPSAPAEPAPHPSGQEETEATERETVR
jgi:hypothetical protein